MKKKRDYGREKMKAACNQCKEKSTSAYNHNSGVCKECRKYPCSVCGTKTISKQYLISYTRYKCYSCSRLKPKEALFAV